MGHGNRSVEPGLQQQETNGGRWIFDFLSRGLFLLTYNLMIFPRWRGIYYGQQTWEEGQYIVYH